MPRKCSFSLFTFFLASAVLFPAAAADTSTEADAKKAAAFAKTDAIFADYMLDSHVPGLVYGVVSGGKLVYVKGFGVQEFEHRRPVTADTLFRIASMSKAFTALTILKLRDDGKLELEDPAEKYVPEMRGWKYPTQDSPRIRVRDLLNHTAGFVTDDPWGDRQTELPEAEFTALLRQGVPFSSPPATRMEYSNFGYALLGRIITNVSGRPYADTIGRTLLQPLGMQSTGFVVDQSPLERRALGYRWEDDAWKLEPTLKHGAFGAMGGIQTSANDYAKWVAYLLSAWPPRDEPDRGPVRRATVRELAQGSNFPSTLRLGAGQSGSEPCTGARTYGMGLIVFVGCDPGSTLLHNGGYPGYGSNMLLFPDRGFGIFVFTNRTYSGPVAPNWEAAVALGKSGIFDTPATSISHDLADAYRAVGEIYKSGSVDAHLDKLAMNFLLDKDAGAWNRQLIRVRKAVGECDVLAPVSPKGKLAGDFKWRCEHGRVSGSLLLAPTSPPRIQQLKLDQLAR